MNRESQFSHRKKILSLEIDIPILDMMLALDYLATAFNKAINLTTLRYAPGGKLWRR